MSKKLSKKDRKKCDEAQNMYPLGKLPWGKRKPREERLYIIFKLHDCPELCWALVEDFTHGLHYIHFKRNMVYGHVHFLATLEAREKYNRKIYKHFGKPGGSEVPLLFPTKLGMKWDLSSPDGHIYVYMGKRAVECGINKIYEQVLDYFDPQNSPFGETKRELQGYYE